MPAFAQVFPDSLLKEFWAQAQPHRYHYKVYPPAVAKAIMFSMMARVASTSELLEHFGDDIHTHSKSTLSTFLANPAFGRFVQLMLLHLESWEREPELPQPTFFPRLRPVDGMGVTLPKTARSDCARFNDNTIGIGMIWALELDPEPGRCPFQVLEMHRGLGSETQSPPPPADGATNLYDRGFSSHRVLARRLASSEHFIQRLRRDEVIHSRSVRVVSAPRKTRSLRVLEDSVAIIGAACPVEVRLVRTELPNGKPLILATDHVDWSRGKILAAYRRRWPIETMHRLLKDGIGLAHLYSLQQVGMKVQLELSLILAGLAWIGRKEMGMPKKGKTKVDVVTAVREEIQELRRKLDRGKVWKRNISKRSYKKKRKPKDRVRNQPSSP